uniref:Carboxylic ester hydrolase n=1 Tax=Panagrolaimus sp. JU765 TaxID=591449 RepID=A0AC34RHE0_9BILA
MKIPAQLVLFVLVNIIFCDGAPTVTTSYGDIEGFDYQTETGFDSEVFLKVPFAKPPIGELRYEKPVAPEPSNSTLMAKSFGPYCATFTTSTTNHSEDCLYLNIMRPANLSSDDGYPVAFWIHGGGNYGLWDLYQALTFVKEVIGDFGGNPNKVTIFGQSAGAACVSYLSLKPEAENLFTRVIQMSGTSQALWAQGDDTVDSSNRLNTYLGCNNATSPKECLKSFSTSDIQTAVQSFILTFPAFGSRIDTPDNSFFNPRIDGDFLTADNFSEAIQNAPKRTNLFGINSHETTGYSTFVANYSTYIPVPYYKIANFSEADFSEAVHAMYGTVEAFGNNSAVAAESIINWYSNNSIYTHDVYMQNYGQIIDDLYFTVFGRREAKMKTEKGDKVYYYRYSYVSTLDPITDGVRHSMELPNLFQNPSTPEGKQVQSKFLDLYENFIKTGQPMVENYIISAVTDQVVPFLDIDVNITLETDLWPERGLLEPISK